jgi:AcrR family transcriptional regulator
MSEKSLQNENNASQKRYRGVSLDERVTERRRRLIEGGIALYGSAGFRATSVKTICLSIGLTERYFYESFANGEELLCATCTTVMHDLRMKALDSMAGKDDTPSEKFMAAAQSYFSEIRGNPAAARLTLFEMEGVSASVDAHYAKELATTTDLLANALFSGITPKGHAKLQAVILAQGIVGALYQIAKEWVRTDFALPTDVMARHMQAIAIGVVASYSGAILE